MEKLSLIIQVIILKVQILLQYILLASEVNIYIYLNIYKEIKNVNISIEKAEEDEKKFQSNLSEIISGNPKYRKKYQSDAIKNIRNLYNSRQKFINLFDDYS